MRFYWPVFSTWVMVAAATAPAENINAAELLAELPSCSLGCIVTALSSSDLGFNNLVGTCTNDTLQAPLSACIQGQCNITEQFEIAAAHQQLCNGVPFASRSWLISIWGVVLAPLGLIAIGLRCYSRLRIALEFGYDDWIIVAAGAFLAGIVALNVTNAMNGFGRHFWDLNPLRIPSLLKIFWVLEIFYIVVSTMVRASILLFYLRVFPVRSFRIVNFIIMGLVLATGTAVTFVVIFQCSPISGVWDRTLHAKCVNVNTLAYATGGISIALDIIVLILPIPQLLGLKTSLKKKVNLMVMFSLGSLACITSIIRLKFIINFSNSVDQTWDNVIPAIWSLAEIVVATICACLPAIRILLAQWLPSIFDFKTLPRSDTEIKSSSNQNSSFSSEPRFREIKVGPSYNKRVIQTPDEALLAECGDPKHGTFSSKIRVAQSKFGDAEHFYKPNRDGKWPIAKDVPSTTAKSRASSTQSSHSEMFAFEGPLVNEDIDNFPDEVGVELKTPTEWKGKDKEIRVVDSISVMSHRIPEKDVPAVLPYVIRPEWNEGS